MGGSTRDDFVHDVRAAADIETLIGDYVSLKQAGRKHKGLCPFHNEKTPSFTVDTEKGLFYCFGCQVGGDVFKFYMLHEKVEFPDALREIARRFGVPIPERSQRGAGEHTRLAAMHQEAARLFQAALASPAGAGARRYLEQRGLNEATVQELQIGYAPESWDALKARLRRSGYSEDEILKAGLTVKGKKEGQGGYDRFRNRLMFPIQQAAGGVIGFGGRILGDGEPKYLNSPETPLFHKGRHFYGLNWSREAIRREDQVIIVEGYTDFAALWQAGVRHVVAVLGTGFTTEHARLLARYSRRVVINFDADRAGRQAADRAVAVLMEHDFDLRVMELPPGEDPDGFVRSHGAEAYLERAAQAPAFVDHLIGRAWDGDPARSPEERARAVSTILPGLVYLRNRVLVTSALSRIADRLDLRESDVRAEYRRIAPALRRGEAAPEPVQPARRRPSTLAERQLIALLLTYEDVRLEFSAGAREEELGNLAAGPILKSILSLQHAGHVVSVDMLQGVLEEADRSRLMEAVVEEFPGLEAAHWQESWHAIRREHLERQSRSLQRQLSRGMEEGADAADVDDLLRRKLEVRRMIEALG